MQKTSRLAKKLLVHCQQVFQQSKGKLLNDETIQFIENDVTPLNTFLGLNDLQTIVLSYYIHMALKEEETSIDELIKHFGNDLSILPVVNGVIEQLIEKGLIIEKVIEKALQKEVLKSVVVNQRTLLALVNGKKKFLKHQALKNILQLMEQIETLTNQRDEKIITTATLMAEAKRILYTNQHLLEISWLKSFNLSLLDQITFLIVCHEFYSRSEYCDILDIVDKIMSDRNERHTYRNNLIKGKNFLINKELIQFDPEEFSTFKYVQLTIISNTIIFRDGVSLNKTPSFSRGILLSASTIKEEKLFYNKEEQFQLELLQDALTEDRFNVLSKTLQDNNLTKGFTILLHGAAGTGKTSTVSQIAQKTGRNIYMVDINKIRDKWVGESERNVNWIFREYEQARKYFPKTPILLFNEADAILSKRFQVSGSVDQMNNTMQNILLQKLEEFEGIFIATTNLLSNLDVAFNRRLLYKIEFKNPEPEVRMQILQNAFPGVERSTLIKINQKYHLTGGQIMNLKKKLLVEQLLRPETDVNLRLEMACAEEMHSFGTNQSKPIGFLKRA